MIKQRRLNTIEAKNKNFTVDNTTNREVDFATTNDEAIKKINVASTANNAANEKNVNVVTALNAINEKEQTSLTNLL